MRAEMTNWRNASAAAGWLLTSAAIYITSGSPTGPGVYPDEICNLGWSRFLAGGQFYNMGGAGYCHPLYPSLIALAQALTGDPVSGYRAAILVNAMLAAACLPLAIGLARRHFGMSLPGAWAAGLLCAGYPPLVGYTRYAWPESLLYPLALLWLRCWCDLVSRPDWKRAGLLLASTAAIYFAHPRMIVFPIFVGAAGVALWAFRRTPSNRQIALLAVLLSLATIISMAPVKSLVLPLAWSFDSMPSVAFVDSSHAAKSALLLARVGGQLLFATWITLGVALIPLAYALVNLQRIRSMPDAYLKIAVVPGLLIAATGLVALFVVHSERFDVLFYGRYIGPLIPLSLLVGLSLCGQADSRKLSGIVLLVAAACAFAVLMAPAPDVDADYSRIHILGLSPLIDRLYDDVGGSRFRLIIASSTATAMCLGAIAVRHHWSWAAGVLLSLFAALHLTGETRRTISATAYLPTGELARRFSQRPCQIYWPRSVGDRRQRHQAYRIQYAFPDCQLVFLTELNCEVTPPGMLILDANARGCPSRARATYHLEPGLRVQELEPATP